MTAPTAVKSPPRLERVAFQTSRLLDFVGRRELTAQIGHEPELWPLVVVKELLDNALDACEEAETAPQIVVEVSTEPGSAMVKVTDNGPGLAAETVGSILDYSTRTSSREAYCSPTRGSQGNALKTIVAMPYALDAGACGETQIVSRGLFHRITFTADAVRQVPRIDHQTEPAEGEIGKTGTSVTVCWPDTASHQLAAQKGRFLQIAAGYAVCNPHLCLLVLWNDEVGINLAATDTGWPKWRACDPTSPSWYTPQRLERYAAAHVARYQDRGQSRTVRDFIAEFRGLAGSAKQKLVLDESGLARQPLAALFDDGAVDERRVAALLAAMQRHSRPIKPRDLGVIGSDHFLNYCTAARADDASFRYRLITGATDDDIPFVVEAAFAAGPQLRGRRLVLGVNFAAALGNPFRTFGVSARRLALALPDGRIRTYGYGYGDGLETQLAERRCGHGEPVVVILHLACARVEYQDRGKSAVVLDGATAEAINTALDSVTGPWAKQRKTEDRREQAETRRWDRIAAAQSRKEKPEKEKPDPCGALGEKLADEAAALGVSFEALTVLSARNDPYLAWRRQREAAWFAEQFEALVGSGAKHLRGFHYILVMVPEGVRRPDGSPYVNDFKCWVWLQEAGKAARWLGYLGFDRIIDERNAQPEVFVPAVNGGSPESSLSSGLHCEIPTIGSLLPSFSLTGFTARQPYRLVFYGEKSSLAPILRPIAEELGTELILPTGDTSHTLVAGMAARAAADDRPTVVFYFSDFDPGGWNMPVSVSRQLQALKDLRYPKLDIRLYPAALTLAQVRDLRLPSKPLKTTERRANRWREAMGHEQTEIDALIEGHPGVLRRIARDAVKPFYDFTLGKRLSAAESDWLKENRARLLAHPGYKTAQKRIAAAVKRLGAAAGKLHSEQSAAAAALNDVVTPPPELPKPSIETAAPAPLFDSNADFVTATRRLQAHRRYKDDDDDEE